MALPPTLCVQGIKDGVQRETLEREFEAYGPLVRVEIAPGNSARGMPDSRIAFVEFERREHARKAMQKLNGRKVAGKCVMIAWSRSSAGAGRLGTKDPQPMSFRHSVTDKFRHASRSRSKTRSPSRSRRGRSRTRSGSRRGCRGRHSRGRAFPSWRQE